VGCLETEATSFVRRWAGASLRTAGAGTGSELKKPEIVVAAACRCSRWRSLDKQQPEPYNPRISL